MKTTLFKGSGTAIITPFKNNGDINFDELEKLIEFQIKNQTDAIVACGTTGEAATMSTEEHLSVIEFIVNKVNGRIPVIAGTGSNDTKYSVELSLEAKKLGADALLLITPYYNKTSQQGLIDSFNYIVDNVKIPSIVYNVPTRTALNILPETYYQLSKNPYIVAAKEANGDINSVIKTMSLCGDDLAFYSGDDIQTLPIVALGGLGVISVFSNIYPQQMHDLVTFALDKNYDKAKEILFKYTDVMNALFTDVSPIPIKEALNLIGFDCRKCRLPLTSMNETAKLKMVEVLKKHGAI